MRLHLCGVRGSSPAPGPSFHRVGGHTSCVAVAHDDDPVPRLVLDAGTGLRNLADLLQGQPFQGTLLLGHLHWDHTQGLPFFAAGDRREAHVQVLLPAQGVEARELLSRMMGPPFFPIEPHELGGSWSFGTVEEGHHDIEEFRVLARHIPHPGGRAFGYRISDGRSAMAYLSDHGPLDLGPGPHGWGEYHDAALALAHDVDVLLHDAQYTPEELAEKPHYGHSAIPYALELAVRAGVRTLVLFHHDPSRTDDEVDRLTAEAAAAGARHGVEVVAACEGDTIKL